MKGKYLVLKSRLNFFRTLSGIAEKRKIFLIKILQDLEEKIKVIEAEELKMRKKLVPMAYFDFLFIYEKPFKAFRELLEKYYQLVKNLEKLRREKELRERELDKFSRLENALEEFLIPQTREEIKRIKRMLEEKDLEEIATKIFHPGRNRGMRY